MESLISHTEKIYYFVVNYNAETLSKNAARGYEESIESWFSGGSTRFEDAENTARYF